MAMVVSRLGQAAGAGDSNALFLKQFAGEILTAFQRANVMMPLHTVRSIQSGKSAQFPVTGTASARYHTPGESIIEDADAAAADYLSRMVHNERVITIDDLLTSSTFVDSLDDAKNHYDVRSIYSNEMGQALGKKADQQLLQLVCLASRAGATAPQLNGGGSVEIAATGAPTAGGMIDALFSAAAQMDGDDVPDFDRYAVLNPTYYYALANSSASLVSATNKDVGGTGSLAKGNVIEVAGITIFKSNNIPAASISADAGAQNTYNGDFSDTVGVVFQRGAVGTVKLKDLAVESEYQVERQGTLLVGKYAMGHGILRPEWAVELLDAS